MCIWRENAVAKRESAEVMLARYQVSAEIVMNALGA
jgi:hypothetical protein